MTSSILQQLASIDTWGVVIAVAALGAAGSLVHRAVTDGTIERWWKSGLVGAVAAVGVAAFSTPGTGTELVGMAALSGFFARSLLAALEARIKLELSRQQADRALSLAGDAIDLSRRTRTPTTPTTAVAADLAVGQLSARLDEVRALAPAAIVQAQR